MKDEDIMLCIQRKYQSLLSILDERTLRLWAAVEAREIGHSGQSIVSIATGLSRRTIYAGLSELDQPLV